MSSISAAKKKDCLPQCNVGAWTEDEHDRFKKGVLRVGWSNWKAIQEYYVPTRTKDQIKSHAQKFALHHPEHAKKLKQQEYTNDLMGKVHATKVHGKFKIPKSGLAQAEIVEAAAKRDIIDACAILRRLSKEQLAVVFANFDIAVLQSPNSAVTMAPNQIIKTQVAMDHINDHNLAARVSPTSEYEESADDIFEMASIELFSDDASLTEVNQYISKSINLQREEIQVSQQYMKIYHQLNQLPDINNPKECIVSDNFSRKVLSKESLMRTRLTGLLQSHIDSNWWKGDSNSVTAPIRGDAKSQEVIKNEQEVEHAVALLVIMYDLEEWRSLSSPGNVFELGDTYAVVYKANEVWTRIKASLMRGGYTLFGVENGVHRACLIQSIVDSLTIFCKELELSCYLDLA